MDITEENAYQIYIGKPSQKHLNTYISRLIKNRKYEQAETCLELCTDPTNIDFLSLCSQIKRYLGKYEESEIYCNKIINLAKDDREKAKGYYELFRLYELQIKTLKYNNSKITSLELSNIISTLKLKSENSILQAYALTSYSFYAKSLANLYFYNNDFSKAIIYYEKLCADLTCSSGDRNYAKFKVAIIKQKRGYKQEALKMFLELVNTNPPQHVLYDLYNYIGCLYSDLKNYTMAIKYIELYFKGGQSSMYMYYQYGKLNYEIGKYDIAVKYLSYVINANEKNPTYYKSLYTLAKLYEKNGDYLKAIEFYEPMLEGTIKDKNMACLGIAINYRKQANCSLALKYLDMVDLSSDNYLDEAYYYIEKSKIYQLLHKPDESLLYINKAIQISNGTLGLFEKAKILLSINQNEQGLRILDEIIESDSKDVCFALVERAKQNMIYEKYDSAIKDCLKVKSTDINYSFSLFIIIKCLMSLKRTDEINTYIEKLKKENTPISQAYLKIIEGMILCSRGEYLAAIQKFTNIDDIYLKYEGKVNIAKIYLIEFKDYPKFFEYFKKLLNCANPDIRIYNDFLYKIYIYFNENNIMPMLDEFVKANDVVYTYISFVSIVEYLSKNAQYRQAINFLIDNENNIEKSSKYYYKLADLYYLEKEYTTAFIMFEKCLKYNEIKQEYIYLKMAKCKICERKYDEAIKYLQLLKNTDLEPYAKNELAYILRMQNKTAEAELAYRDLLNSSNRNIALYQLAKMRRKNHNYEQANELLYEIINTGTLEDILLAKLEMAKNYYSMRNYTAAREIYINIIEKLKNDLNDFHLSNDISINYCILQYARFEKLLKNNDKAKELYSMIDSGKERIFAIQDMIDIYTIENDYYTAQQFVEKLNNDNTKDYYYLEKAKISLEISNYDDAKLYLSKVNSARLKEDRIFYEGKLCFFIKDYNLAKEKFNSLIQNDLYREDAIIFMGKIYMMQNNYEQAKEFFQNCYERFNNYKALKYLVTLDIKYNNYDEALKNNMILSQDNRYYICSCIFFCIISKELNIAFPESYYGNGFYSSRMVCNYNEADAIDHIKHHAKELEYRTQNTKFENLDYDELYDIIPQFLTNEYLINCPFMDIYEIPLITYSNTLNGYLRVVTIPNTKQIITMYPSGNTDEISQLNSSL